MAAQVLRRGALRRGRGFAASVCEPKPAASPPGARSSTHLSHSHSESPPPYLSLPLPPPPSLPLPLPLPLTPSPSLRLPGKKPGVVEIELKFFFRVSELVVEPSRSCKSLKLAGIFLVYTHPKWCASDSSNPILILIGPLPLRLPHPSEMISIFI